jgi:lysophospholipase L1-like esterase
LAAVLLADGDYVVIAQIEADEPHVAVSDETVEAAASVRKPGSAIRFDPGSSRELQMTSLRGFSLLQLATRLRALVLAMIMAAAAPLASALPSDAPGSDSFLALGDSVVFGFITQAGFMYLKANNFIGYPDYVGADLRLDTTNSACPGETTSGFISDTGSDNGCRIFKQTYPLHVAYTSTQLDFAKSFLAAHKHVKLVTVALGANDVFVLQKTCGGDPACIQAGLPAVLATVGSNMSSILTSVRATGFRGVLIVVNYYSIDYSDPFETGVTAALNQTLGTVAGAHGAAVADAFAAFQAAASTLPAPNTGMTCVAGLLNASPQNEFLCDVHPSQSGQQLLADTVNTTYKAALGKGKRH